MDNYQGMKMAGYEVRTTKKGRQKIRATVRLAGFQAKRATFDKKRDAVAWATRLETDMREGRHDKNAAAKKYTVADAINRYIETVLPVKSKKINFIKQQRRQLLWWRSRIGMHKLINITPAVIAQERDILRKRVSSSTTNRYMAALSSVLGKAWLEWEWITVNPIKKIEKLQEPRGRVRFLSESERDALIAACKKHKCQSLYVIVLIAISTGARKGEILSLRWEDYDYIRCQIVVHETKNDERRTLYLRGLCNEYICDLYIKAGSPKEGLIFSSRNKNQPMEIDIYWRQAVRAARLKDFRFHDLRHTAASYLAMNGTSMIAIAELLGHKTLDNVKRYAHLSQSHTAEQVEAMNKKIFG